MKNSDSVDIGTAYAQRGRILCIDSPVFDAADEIPVSSDYSTVLRNGHSWHSHLWKGFDSRNCRDKSQLSDVKPEFEFPGAFEGQMVQFFMADPYRGATNRIANAVLVFAFNSNGDLLMCHNVSLPTARWYSIPDHEFCISYTSYR